MIKLLCWFMFNRWSLIKHTRHYPKQSREILLGKLTDNGFIPATGIIASDAAMILLFDDEQKFNRVEFMDGWRASRSIIHGATDKLATIDMLRHYTGIADARGWETSYIMGAKLAIEQFDNLMASRHR